MIIYYLYHEYELYENCMERKDIGLFVSEAEAKELIASIKNYLASKTIQKIFIFKKLLLMI